MHPPMQCGIKTMCHDPIWEVDKAVTMHPPMQCGIKTMCHDPIWEMDKAVIMHPHDSGSVV